MSAARHIAPAASYSVHLTEPDDFDLWRAGRAKFDHVKQEHFLAVRRNVS